MDKKKKLLTLLLLPALATAASVAAIVISGQAVSHATVLGKSAEPKDYFFSYRENSILKINNNGDPILFNLDSAVAIVTKGDDIEYYTDIDKALAAWEDGSTLTLNKDVTAQITVSEGTKTLDLNNHVLSYDNDSVIKASGGELHVEDNSLNKTTHYYQLSAAWKAYGDVQKGPATISDTPTDYSFEGGYITSNNTTYFPDGAGILVSGGHVVFSSGTVFGTTAGSGGIRVQPNGHLTLEGSAGVIGNFQKRDWCSTGGIDVSGRLDMTGGRVIHNSALTSVGGLRFRADAEIEGNYFRIVGGEITQNYCETDLGHGIFIDNSKGTAVQIGGSAKIHDNGKPDFPTRANNLHFNKADDKMQIVEPFEEDANVWACWNKVTPSAEYPVTMTNNWSEVMGEKDPYNYLHYDVSGNEVYLKDGQAVAGPISYKVSFDGNSATGTMDSTDTTSREYKLPDNGFTAPEGKRFLAWKYGDKLYLPGDKVLLSGDATITAQWVNKPGEEAFGLSGVIYENNGEATAEGAVVKLIKGNQLIDMVGTDSSGAYGFTCDPGIYNLVVEYNDVSRTTIVEVYEDNVVKDIALGVGQTDAILTVESNINVAVGGLDAEADAIRVADSVPDDKSVLVSMNVVEKASDEAENADKIIASDTTITYDEFIEASVNKSIDGVVSSVSETNEVIEIVVPYANVNKRDVTVASYHGEEVVEYTEANTKEDGTFILDKDNGLVKIYTKKFSIFALGYTPYFNLGTKVTLGSYTGVVTATLENVVTKEKITLENVTLDKVVFSDLKKGDYILTITWVDGVTNSITMPVKIG